MAQLKIIHLVLPDPNTLTGNKLQTIRTAGEKYQIAVYRSVERPVGDLSLYIDGLKELGEGLHDATLDYEIVHGELSVNIWGWRDATDEEDALIREEAPKHRAEVLDS